MSTSRVVVLLALACCAPAAPGVALAQEEPEPRVTRERNDLEPAPVEPIDVSLRLPSLRWLPRRDFVPEVTLRRLPPGSLVIRYAGIHAVVVRRVQGRLRALWQDSIQDAWEAGILDDEAYAAELDRMFAALADHRAGGRWWERSWHDSLLPRLGGAPAAPVEARVGERLELVRLGPLKLTNDLRAYVDRVAVLTVDPDATPLLRGTEPSRLAREHAWLIREARDEGEPQPVIEDGPEDPADAQGVAASIVRATFEPPAPVLLRTRWRLTLRPSVSLRATGVASEVVRDLRLRTSLELFREANLLRFVTLEFVVRYRPDDGEVVVGLELVLFTW